MTAVYIGVAVVALALAFSFFAENVRNKNELRAKEKEIEENAKKTNEAIKRQSEEKQSVRTGDDAANFNASINILHDHAKN